MSREGTHVCDREQRLSHHSPTPPLHSHMHRKPPRQDKAPHWPLHTITVHSSVFEHPAGSSLRGLHKAWLSQGLTR